MEYFEKFVSNTTAASGNQLIFTMEKGEIRTSRAFYKIFAMFLSDKRKCAADEQQRTEECTHSLHRA